MMNFDNYGFEPNEMTKKMLSEAGESFAAAALSAAAIAFLGQMIKNGILAPAATCIEIDNTVPAQIYAIGKKDGAKAVYISTKKHRMNLLPAVMLAAAGLVVHMAVGRLNEEEKDTVNV